MTLFQHRFSGATPLGTPWMFTWWAVGTDTLAATHPRAVTWFTSAWNNAINVSVVAACTGTRVDTSQVTESTGKQENFLSSSVSLVGTAVGISLPTDVSIAVTLRSDTITRSGRGRFFLPPPAVSVVATGGRVATATLTDLADALKAAFDVYTSGGEQNPVIYSRLLRSTREVRTIDIGDFFDTQRLRQDRLPETRTTRALA